MSAYRKPLPYRKPQTYRGESTAIPSVPINAATCGAAWQKPTATARVIAFPMPAATHQQSDLSAPFGPIAAHAGSLAAPSHELAPHALDAALPWDAIATHQRSAAAPYVQPAPHDRETALQWGDFTQHPARSTSAPWVRPAAHQQALALAWGALATHARALSSLWRQAAARGAYVALPWGPIGARSTSIVWPWPVDPPIPDPGTGGDPITVPIQAVYIMIPTIEAMTLPGNVAFPVLNVTISGDLKSWAWTFAASIPASALPLVDPGSSDSPAQIQITVNGYAWTFFVEGVDDNRRFGSKTINIRGRSRSAELAAPYAPIRTYTQDMDLDASQLANNELTPYGWTLLWNTVDWLVPAGTFSYQDLAPIDALGKLAAAVGASVISDPADLSITVQPEYPDSPWSWAGTSPYAILPASILTQGDGSWQGGVNANGVYVYAENAGFGALVKLEGTDGAMQIPMVVERLAISADPARERGRIELARAGRIKTENRVIPLFPAPASPGLIPLGALLQINDSATESWLGLVTGVRISANRAGSAISVRQTLTLERQFRPDL